MQKRNVTCNTAFSLVELSIVLVILGLLTGGILTGQSLIRAAELRSITTELSEYQSAVNSFRGKYLSLPGDTDDATDFWQAAHADPATCKATASTSQATCDGDANSLIESHATSDERLRFWQHLANAGLINGSYTGTGGSGGVNHHVPGENVPVSKASQAGWTVQHLVPSGTTFVYDYNNIFQYGGISADSTTHQDILNPEEAWNIDKKIDDGSPGTGNILSLRANRCTDQASGTAYNALYDLQTPDVSCALIFRNAI